MNCLRFAKIIDLLLFPVIIYYFWYLLQSPETKNTDSQGFFKALVVIINMPGYKLCCRKEKSHLGFQSPCSISP